MEVGRSQLFSRPFLIVFGRKKAGSKKVPAFYTTPPTDAVVASENDVGD